MKRFGPGLLVTAAFIGPGTVTTASLAGAEHGFALLWAVLFSIIATIALQEMAARLGIVTGLGLSEALATTFNRPSFRMLAIVLVIAAIAVGNAAFETGNLAGAAMGLEVLTGVKGTLWSIMIGLLVLVAMAFGSYKVIERLLVGLVVLMSLVFILTMIIVKPSLGQILLGIAVPSIPDGATLKVVALIGTTVVPYNLFLHSSSVQETWPKGTPLVDALRESRIDTIFSISIGGMITMAIVVTAAAAFFTQGIHIVNAQTMAQQLEPLLGSMAKYFFSVGIFSAGVSSSITAPLAAAYATSGALGWPKDFTDKKFKTVWMTILGIGIVLSLFGKSPVAAILFAQATNGILLPVSAIYLIIVMNRADLLKGYCNGFLTNLLAFFVVAVAIGLGGVQLLKIFGAFS